MASSLLCPQRRVGVAAALLLASVARAQAPDQQPSSSDAPKVRQPTLSSIQRQDDGQTDADRSRTKADRKMREMDRRLNLTLRSVRSGCGLTKVVALETARTGVTCNAICPGWVLTPLVQKQVDDMASREGLSGDTARAKLLGEKQPSLEFATPEQIGVLATFLCSDAAAQIRGAARPVNGGWTAQ